MSADRYLQPVVALLVRVPLNVPSGAPAVVCSAMLLKPALMLGKESFIPIDGPSHTACVPAPLTTGFRNR